MVMIMSPDDRPGAHDPNATISQNPTDELIRLLCAGERPAITEDVTQILVQVAGASFGSAAVYVPVKHRGMTYHGRSLQRHEASRFYHLVKRVVIERQWAEGTTEEEYEDDLRRATSVTSARLAVYTRWRTPFAAVFVPVADVVPLPRRGPGACPWLVVIYSADRGARVTGYMFTSLAELDIPEDAVWLTSRG